MSHSVPSSLLFLEHDHTRLDVLLEDLEVISRMALQLRQEPEMLEDARQSWHHMFEEILGHFAREEHRLFRQLVQWLPALSLQLEELQNQHLEMRNMLQQIGTLLQGDPDELEALTAQFEAHWQGLKTLWTNHSATEWELLDGVRQQTALQPPPSHN